MLLEFSIIPLGVGTPLSKELTRILAIVDDFGLPYQLTPTGTVVEGEGDEAMAPVHRCHQAARTRSPRVITTIKDHIAVKEHFPKRMQGEE